MEERTNLTQSTDTLVQLAAIKIAEFLTVKHKREFEVNAIQKELFGMKYGIMTDDIPLYLLVKEEMDKNNINIFYKEAVLKVQEKTFVGNPRGNRIRPAIPVEDKK